MKRFLSCLAITTAFILPTIAHADTFVNLAFDGYAHPYQQTGDLHLTGLFTLDTTTGTFVSGSISDVTEPYVFTAEQRLQPDYLEAGFTFSNTVNEFGYSTEPGGAQFNVVLGLDLPVATLVDYQGGNICSESNYVVCGGAGSSFYQMEWKA